MREEKYVRLRIDVRAADDTSRIEAGARVLVTPACLPETATWKAARFFNIVEANGSTTMWGVPREAFEEDDLLGEAGLS